MKTKDFYKMLKHIGIPVAYARFSDDPALPYMTYLEEKDTTVGRADYLVTSARQVFTVDLFDTKRNIELENKLENELCSQGLKFEVEYGDYRSEANVFMTTYTIEIYSKNGE